MSTPSNIVAAPAAPIKSALRACALRLARALALALQVWCIGWFLYSIAYVCFIPVTTDDANAEALRLAVSGIGYMIALALYDAADFAICFPARR